MVDPALARLTLVSGDEELLVTRAVADVIAAARDADPQADVRELDASAATPESLLDLATPSLFGELRVVIFRGAHELDEDVRDGLMAQLTDIPDDLAIVVVHPGGPKGKRLVDACKAASARVVTCAKVKPADRLMFVQEEIRRLGGSVTAGACRAIVEAIGGELRELAGAASQLVADVPGTIDEGAVARFFRGRAEVSGFDVADRALAGDLAGALGELRAALGGGLDPVPIIAALAGKLRTAARVASAGRNARREAVAADLGIAPWMVDKARKQITGWTPDALAAAYTAVARADWAAKGGGTDAKYAVERAVLEVVAQRRGTAVGANA